MGTNKNQETKRYRLLLASNLCNIFGFALFLPLYGVYITQLGRSPETGSMIWAVHTLLTGLLVLFVGKVEDRLHKGYFKALVAGNVLQVTGTIIFLFSTDFAVFAAGLLVYSVGTAILAPSWFSLFSASISRQHAAKGWSISQGCGALAGALGAATGGVLLGLSGFRGVFMGVLLFHLCGLMFATTVLKIRH